MISQQYVATSAKIISFETICCKLQNTAPIMHLVQTWILEVIGSPSTDSSVAAHEETRALWIFRTQLRMSLVSRTFLSALLSPSWSVCLSVSLCPLYSRLLWILPIFCPPHQFSRTVHQVSFNQEALTRCSPGTRPFWKTAVSGAKSGSHSMVHSHQEASKIRHIHTETNKNHSRRTTCHVLLRFICLPAHKDPRSE